MPGRQSAWILLTGFLVAIAAGYWFSSVVGTEAIREEAETQLSALLASPVQVRRAGLAVQGGLFFQGESVAAYPDPTSALGSRLFAKRVVAEIDLLALLTGRFRLSGLVLEDVTFDIRREAEAAWRPLPIQALARMGSRNLSPDEEAYLDFFSGFEKVTRTLLRAPIAADRFEIRRGRVIFLDDSERVSSTQGARLALSLENLNGVLIHHWLSGEAQLNLEGTLRSAQAAQTSFRVVGENDGADQYRLRVSTQELPLAILDPYLSTEDRVGWPEGPFTGSIDYQTHAEKTGTLAIRWLVSPFRVRLPVGDSILEVDREELTLGAVGQLTTDSVRLTGTLFDSDGIGFGFDAEAGRPLRASSPLQVTAEVHGLTVETLEKFASKASPTGRDTFAGLETGRIENIGMAGTMNLEDWDELLSGSPTVVPRPISLSAEVKDVAFSSDEGDRYSDLAGRIELRGDTFLLRRGRGLRNEEPLPALNMRVNGFSNLFRIASDNPQVDAEAPAFPGLDTLLEIFGSQRDRLASETAGTDQPSKTLGEYRVWIDRLEFPSLPWVMEDGAFSIGTRTGSTKIRAESMVWGGIPMSGNLTWTTAAEDRLQVVLEAGPPVSGPESQPASEGRDTGSPMAASTGDPPEPEIRESSDPWARGRIEIGRLRTGLLPINEFRGEFVLRGASVSLSDCFGRLEPRGSIRGELGLSLESPDSVPVALTFDIAEADMSRVTEIFGIKPGDITGTLDLRGTLTGELRPNQRLLTDLAGRVDLEARRGELRRDELPLLLALAQASEGYNEYAERASIAYESMTADINLADRRIVTRNFELEGPLRIYASGSLDIIEPPYDLIGVAGLFLFRGAGQLLEAVPLVKIILPGSERGLMGTYYQISGDLFQPQVRSLPGRSFAEGLPDVLEAPYQILRAIVSGGNIDEGRTEPDPAP